MRTFIFEVLIIWLRGGGGISDAHLNSDDPIVLVNHEDILYNMRSCVPSPSKDSGVGETGIATAEELDGPAGGGGGKHTPSWRDHAHAHAFMEEIGKFYQALYDLGVGSPISDNPATVHSQTLLASDPNLLLFRGGTLMLRWVRRLMGAEIREIL